MSVSSSAPDPDRLRVLVRGSRFAIGLIALRDRTFLELSPPAALLTGLYVSDTEPLDVATLSTDPGPVRATLGLIADGVLDACRMRTTRPAASDGSCLLVSLRVVARTGNQAYAIARFTAEGERGLPTFEHCLASLGELGDPSWPIARAAGAPDCVAEFPGFDGISDRQREILTRLARGDRVPTISRSMHLAASTVRNHLATLYRKVGVHSQAELVEHLHAASDR